MTGVNEATVITLTAEVKTLVLGARQVTLGVFAQLDQVPPEEIIPFGRVSPPGEKEPVVQVVGKHRETGTLVRSSYPISWKGRRDYIASQPGWKDADDFPLSPEVQEGLEYTFNEYRKIYLMQDENAKDAAEEAYRKARDDLRKKSREQYGQAEEELKAKATEWQELPLIVLAGLGLK